MTDIVHRLRKSSKLFRPEEHEAADEIESLRQQLAECERERDEWKELAKGIDTQLRTELASVTKELDDLIGRPIPLTEWQMMEQYLATVTKERDELVAALKDAVTLYTTYGEQLVAVTLDEPMAWIHDGVVYADLTLEGEEVRNNATPLYAATTEKNKCDYVEKK